MVFSAIPLETRLEVQDLMNNFCFSLQHCDEMAWSDLFCTCATINAGLLCNVRDGVELPNIPESVRDLGDGAWRFHLFNLVLRPGEHRNFAMAHANIAILDSDDHLSTRVFDCTFELRNVGRWRITRFEATPVRRRSQLSNAIAGGADESAASAGHRATLN